MGGRSFPILDDMNLLPIFRILKTGQTILFVYTKAHASHHDDAFPSHVLLTEITKILNHRAFIIQPNEEKGSTRTNKLAR